MVPLHRFPICDTTSETEGRDLTDETLRPAQKLVKSQARSQSNWRSNSSSSKSVNRVQFEAVQGENRAMLSEPQAVCAELGEARERDVTRLERDSYECNLVQLYAEHVGDDGLHGDSEHLGHH